MRTRSQARKRRQQQVRQTSVEPPNLEKPNNNQELFNPPIVTMADNRTMAQLLEAPTEGYEDAIVVLEITANNFEIKHGDKARHGFSELHQLDTFYNALNSNDQDSLNSAAGGNFLDKMPRECLKIIESKSKVRQSQSKAIVSKVSTNSSTLAVSSDVCLSLKNRLDHQFVNSNTASTSGSVFFKHIIANPKGDVKAITTQSGVSYNGPQISSPPKEKENKPEMTKDTVQPSTENIQPPGQQRRSSREKGRSSSSKLMENFSNLHFELVRGRSILHMPKFAPMFKKLPPMTKIKDRVDKDTGERELQRAVILKKFPEKLGDPGRFLIPCDFPEMNECLALADLGASINLMPSPFGRNSGPPALTKT
ncbi:hypothetical protein Tco_0547625 [Tanacetum coccineum]